MSTRPVKRIIRAKPTMEGAGVHLHRAFGFGNTSDFDPFLLLDDFRSDTPGEYLAGFPGTRTAVSKQSRMFLPAPSSTATASEIAVSFLPATSNG